MTQSHSEVTVIDRQKYVAELGKLLSGMAPQDREAVLRGINARFDAEGDDAAVIASLGSPTFAAVTVLRGYTPPEEGEPGSRYEPEPEPAQEPEPEPVQEHEPAAEAEPAPEAEAEPEAQAGPGPEPQASRFSSFHVSIPIRAPHCAYCSSRSSRSPTGSMPSTLKKANSFPSACAFRTSAAVRTSASQGHSASSSRAQAIISSVRCQPSQSGWAAQMESCSTVVQMESPRPPICPACNLGR